MFDLNAYRLAQQAGTRAMADSAPRMLEMVQDMRRKQGPAGGERRTLKSFLLQEGEAASRQAKCRWCRERGIDIYQLQHDGIVVGKRVDGGYVAGEMSEAASAACGMKVVVQVEE